MNLLVIDSSTKSLVLGLQAGSELIDRTSEAFNAHSKEILPAISRLIGDAGIEQDQLDAIVFGQGPGSFTGLRIAVGVVQGLGYGLNVPVVPVSSMACLAQSMLDYGEPSRVFVALTARLEEIYYGSYQFEDGVVAACGPEGVMDVGLLQALEKGAWIGVGDAWALREKIEASLGVDLLEVSDQITPQVCDLVTLGLHGLKQGKSVSALDARPVYLREEVATKPVKK